MHIYSTSLTPKDVFANVHRLHSVHIENETVSVTLNSFVNDESVEAVWQGIYPMPWEDFVNTTYPWNVLNYLVSTSGPFPTGAIIHDPTDLLTLKRKLVVRVNELRKTVIDGGCETHVGVVDTTENSRSNIAATYSLAVAAKMASQPFEIVWRLRDNSEVTLDADGLILMGNQVFAHVDRAMRHSWTLKAEIEAAETVEAAEAVRIDYGWLNTLPVEEAPVEEGE